MSSKSVEHFLSYEAEKESEKNKNNYNYNRKKPKNKKEGLPLQPEDPNNRSSLVSKLLK